MINLDIVAILVSIGLAIIGTYTSRKCKRKVRFILYAAFIIFTSVLCIRCIYDSYQKRMDYKRQVMENKEKIFNTMELEDYTEAIRLIDEFLQQDLKDSDYIDVKLMKADCYFYQGIDYTMEEIESNSNDYYEYNKYYEKAAEIYEEIKAEKITEETYFNVEVMQGMAYLFLDENIYNDELNAMIADIEEKLENDGNIDYPFNQIQLLLFMYYFDEYSESKSEEDLEKALVYGESACELQQNLSDINVQEHKLQTLLDSKVALLYYEYFMQHLDESSMYYLEKAVNIVEKLNKEYIETDSKREYYANAFLAGKCYSALSFYYLDKGYEEKAYEYLKIYLYEDNENLDEFLLKSEIYMFLDLEEKDLEIVKYRLERLIQKGELENNTKLVAEAKYTKLVWYFGLSVITGNHTYYDEGKSLLCEIKQRYMNYYNEFAKEEIAEIEKYVSDKE